MKSDMAKRMNSPKYVSMPPHTPRQKSKSGGNIVQGDKHGSKGKELTMKKDKHFTKDSSNANYGKNEKKPYGGWENS